MSSSSHDPLVIGTVSVREPEPGHLVFEAGAEAAAGDGPHTPAEAFLAWIARRGESVRVRWVEPKGASALHVWVGSDPTFHTVMAAQDPAGVPDVRTTFTYDSNGRRNIIDESPTYIYEERVRLIAIDDQDADTTHYEHREGRVVIYSDDPDARPEVFDVLKDCRLIRVTTATRAR